MFWRRVLKAVAQNNVTAVAVTIILVSLGVPAQLASMGGKVAEGVTDAAAQEVCQGGACE